MSLLIISDLNSEATLCRALANLLDRRILIYSGQRALHVTDIAPAKTPSKTDSESEIKENKEETGKGCSETVQEKAKDLDEIYLGHIAEAHYVSLRPIHWKDKLMEGRLESVSTNVSVLPI